MKKVVLVLLVFYAFAKAYAAPALLQEFVSHQVKEGETVASISKDFGITEKAIYKLNPDAKARIYEGLVLILPSTAQKKATSTTPLQEDIKFKTHKVKRKETIYSISKKYNITEDILKRYNKQLYKQTLRKGDKIKIPTNLKKAVEVTEPNVITPKDNTTTPAAVSTTKDAVDYVVKSKETKYGLARKYGITIAQLEQLNPGMGSGLQEGSVIKVPNVQSETQAVIDESQYSFYEVKKGNTMYSLLREFGLKADELLALNPVLDDGLKEGMILKVPKSSAGAIGTTNAPLVIKENAGKISLEDSLTDYSVKNIVVMLPFGLKRTATDTSDARKNLLKKDRVLRLALDFHSGVLMAVEDAEKKGITANISVYDTDYARIDGKATNARKIDNIINGNDFSNVDAVIGPLLGGNVDRASSLLASKRIPVVSPLTQRISGGSNVFQTRPSDDILRARMMEYLKTQGEDKNVVIIADPKNAAVKAKLKRMFPIAKEVVPRKGDNGMFLYEDDIPNQISDTQPNLVIIETNDVPLISQVTTKLNSLLSAVEEEEIVVKRDIVLFTTYKGNAYDSDDIQHTSLMNLNFHFPSMEKEYDDAANSFIDAYETRYKITPSTEAIRGYDIMMDTLLRLGYAQDLYEAAATGLETQYIENKFSYAQSGKGFYNNATYIMKYEEDLKLKEVEIVDKEIED
jgi:LysM repeat protein